VLALASQRSVCRWSTSRLQQVAHSVSAWLGPGGWGQVAGLAHHKSDAQQISLLHHQGDSTSPLCWQLLRSTYLLLMYTQSEETNSQGHTQCVLMLRPADAGTAASAAA
jgi:hypothetical protein